VTVTVSSPDLRPSLVGVLQGLAAAGAIDRVITTLAFARRGGMIRLAGHGPARVEALLRRRVIPDGLEQLVDCIPLGEVLLQASGRLGLGDGAQHRLWMWAEPYFDRRVAERITGHAAVHYGHEHATLASFEAQKRGGGRCALRQVNAHYQFIDATLDEEHDRFGAPETPAWSQIVRSRPQVNARKHAEYELADLIVANSTFVRDTFVQAGIPPAKVAVIPTGCPTPLPACPARTTRPRIVLCAGHLSFRKGTPYLIEAWRRLGVPPSEAELVLAGRTMLPAALLAHLPPGVRLAGALGAPALDRLYQEASLFVLPTLCEGLAHVIPEALAHGLPIITTASSGAADLIADGVNGWMVPVRDPDALAQRIAWCLDRPAELLAMSDKALETARVCSRAKAVASHVDLVLRFARATTGTG
jgi:starch synthase